MRWLTVNDPDGTVLHRALRVALVTPALFAFGLLVLHDGQFALVACFGSFAALAMADFTGPRGSRLLAYLALGLLGIVLVTVGTLLSQTLWPAVIAMFVVGVFFQFLMVMGGQFALGNNAVILAFVVAVMVPGDPSTLPSRVAGWVVALVFAALAATFLWPRHERRDLHTAVAAMARSLAAALEEVVQGKDPAAALAGVDAAAAHLRDVQAVLGFRPAGPPEHQRALLGLIDGLMQASGFARALPVGPAAPGNATLAAAAAQALRSVADVADACAVDARAPDVPLTDLAAARHMHRQHVDDAARAALARGEAGIAVVDAFRAAFVFRVLSYLGVAMLVDAAVMARKPVHLHDDFAVVEPQAPSTVRERWAAALLPHLSLRAVWMRNCLRAGVALALAVLVAKASDIGHAFWVVLATLSVLRGNATTTGATILSALAGVIAGFALATVAMLVIGGYPLAMWIALPLLVFLAGYAPAAISFGAGQAMFALLVVVLFNLIVPEGWEVGAVRVEAVGLGGLVALASSLIMWPRGAAAALRAELALHVRAAATFLRIALGEVMGRPGGQVEEAREAALGARERADAAMAAFMSERSGKRVPLAVWETMARLPVVLRLAGDAAMGLARSGHVGITEGPAARGFADILDLVGRAYDDVGARLESSAAPQDAQRVAAIADLDVPDGAGVRRQAILVDIGAWLDAHRADPAAIGHATSLTWGVGWLGYLAHLRRVIEPSLVQVTSDAQAS